MADEGRGVRQGARFAVRFNDEWWRSDLIGSDAEGRAVTRRARERYERDGVAPAELRACLADGPDGTGLANCVKSYLGAPAAGEPYGIVLVADVIEERVVLRFLAVGERHPRAGVRSVYQRAHRRPHADSPGGSRRTEATRRRAAASDRPDLRDIRAPANAGRLS